MTEAISAISGTLKALQAVVDLRRTIQSTKITSGEINNVPFTLRGESLKNKVELAKGVLDKGKGPDLKRLTDLAIIITEGEIYGEIIKHISHHKLEDKSNWEELRKELYDLETKLEEERKKHTESQSSGHENAVEMPPGNVRRRLLFLSRFPQKYVFNRQRISRLLVAHEFIAAESDEPPLQHLTNWLEPAKSSWDGNGAPNHFLIGNDVEKEKLTPTWPENHYLVREAIVESRETTELEKICSSLIFLGKRNDTLKLNIKQFLFLKVLSLRNINLENEKDLKKLSLLKYLDLKGTNVSDCSWLEGLEELEMLDLRDTDVEKIRDEYLEKLKKLQHLLLGYRPNKEKRNWLAGANLNTTMLTTKLKTLRAIGWHRKINVSLEVADLSVTGLETRDLTETGDQKSFWNVVEKFKNLTRLGVAMTNTSDIELQHCPAELKTNLKRLRMEGLYSTLEELEKLRGFVNLTDLTLALHKPIDTDRIPNLPKLFCLRLYGFGKEETLTLKVQRYKSLKKFVIGDMAKVETVHIYSEGNETVETLKLCNLPKLSELIYHVSNSQHHSQHLLLRRTESETAPPPREMESEMEFHKSIFLRGFEKIHFDKRRGLKIYHYDMNKQCYQEVPAKLTT